MAMTMMRFNWVLPEEDPGDHVGDVQGRARHGVLRRGARLRRLHPRGAPRLGRRLEPDAADDGGHGPGPDPADGRDDRGAARAAPRPAAHRRGHRRHRPRERRPAQRRRRHRATSPTSTPVTARTGRSGASSWTRPSTRCSRRGAASPSSTAARPCAARPARSPSRTRRSRSAARARSRPGSAARFGLPFFPAANMPDLESYYYEQCMEQGTQGFCMMPGEETVMLFVAEDPDKAWAEIGPNLLYEATTYHSWQTPGHQVVGALARLDHRGAAQGGHLPDHHARRGRRAGQGRRATRAAFNLHPMCGGIPVDKAWEHLQLFVDQVWKRLRADPDSIRGDPRSVTPRAYPPKRWVCHCRRRCRRARSRSSRSARSRSGSPTSSGCPSRRRRGPARGRWCTARSSG